MPEATQHEENVKPCMLEAHGREQGVTTSASRHAAAGTLDVTN